MPRNKDEHVAGRDDFFLIAPLLLFRRAQAHDLVGGHERALDLVHVRADAVEDGRHARPREIEGGFPNRLCPGHFAKEFRGLVLVGRKSNANLAVTDDAFIGPVFVHDLANVLCDEVGFKAKTSHVRKRIRKNLHALERREFIDQEQ